MKNEIKPKDSRKLKFRKTFRFIFKTINFTLFVGFCVLAGYFMTNVIDLYQEKKTNLAQSLEPITKLPTIVFCLKSDMDWVYGKNINISYEGSNFEVNHLQEFKRYFIQEANETVQVVQFSDECFKINSTLISPFKQGDDRLIKLNILELQYDPEDMEVQFFFSSEENSYGVFVSDWLEGNVFDQKVKIGHHVEVNIKQHEFRWLKDERKCSDESNFQRWKRIILKSTSELLQECGVICAPFQFLSDELPLCGWSESNEEVRQCSAEYFIENWWDLKQEVGYKMPCTSLDYTGKMTYRKISN